MQKRLGGVSLWGLSLLRKGSAARVVLCALMIFIIAAPAYAQTAPSAGKLDLTNKPDLAPTKNAEMPIKPSGNATTATEIVDGKNQMAMLQANSEQLLRAAEVKYSDIIAQGGFPVVPSGTARKGDRGPGVGLLNRRLFIEGYLRIEGTQGQFAELFTTATQYALAMFQRNHGLAVTGKFDPATAAELNVPAEKRIETIRANIPRLAVYGKDLGERYVVVNIPAQQLEAVNSGYVYQRHNVIVGRPARPTPVVMTPLATVKFNPYWLAPVSIVERDILPKLDHGDDYLKENNFRILRGGMDGVEVDPRTIDFKTAKLEDLLFRQEPGPENAMATAKIEFKSPFGIYLHDTPEKQMFKYDNRFFSSGCIRIQDMPRMVNWILNGQDGYDPARIAGMAKSLERLDVPLQSPPQLRVVYLTAWPAPFGTVAFRNDIYQMDDSGFIMGQPMPVGELSPDGKRFVLRPLPRAVSVDEAEADGKGFFGANAGKMSDNGPNQGAQSQSIKGGKLLVAPGGKPVSAATPAWIKPKKMAQKIDCGSQPDAPSCNLPSAASVVGTVPQ